MATSPVDPPSKDLVLRFFKHPRNFCLCWHWKWLFCDLGFNAGYIFVGWALMWDILQVWGCRRVRIGGISSSNCGKRLDIKLEISIYICAHICICICICARLHIWVVRMFKNGFIAWSAWADWGNTDTWRLAILHPMLSATSIRSLCTPSLCTPHGLHVHQMIFMYTTWYLCTPHGLYVHHIICMYTIQ